MSSSEGTGAGGKAVAAESATAAAPAAPDDDQEVGGAADPWFTPGPKSAFPGWPDADDAAAGAPAPGGDGAERWFLPAGRAGLLPDSMTVSWEDGTGSHADRAAQQDAAGVPPWGAEPTDSAAGAPPPWENGPWPGRSAPAADPPPAPGGPQAVGADAARTTDAGWLSRRRVQVGLGAAAGAVLLVVIIVVIVAGTSAGPTGGCGTYPPAVRQAYASAMSDLRSNAPAPVQAAALGLAASKANASAAAAGQIGVRTALFALAGDLDQAHADVTAHRQLPSALLQHLTADGTALPASCPS